MMPTARQVTHLANILCSELDITSESKRLKIFAILSDVISDWHEKELSEAMKKNIIDLEESQSKEFGK